MGSSVTEAGVCAISSLMRSFSSPVMAASMGVGQSSTSGVGSALESSSPCTGAGRFVL